MVQKVAFFLVQKNACFVFCSGKSHSVHGFALSVVQRLVWRGGDPHYSASSVYGWCASYCVGFPQSQGPIVMGDMRSPQACTPGVKLTTTSCGSHRLLLTENNIQHASNMQHPSMTAHSCTSMAISQYVSHNRLRRQLTPNARGSLGNDVGPP